MQFYKEKLLSPGQLKRLGEHKYNCTTNSLLDGLLQPWWNWLVSKIPLWLAPNLITILGLTVNIVTTLILVYYSPDAKTEVCHLHNLFPLSLHFVRSDRVEPVIDLLYFKYTFQPGLIELYISNNVS